MIFTLRLFEGGINIRDQEGFAHIRVSPNPHLHETPFLPFLHKNKNHVHGLQRI